MVIGSWMVTVTLLGGQTTESTVAKGEFNYIQNSARLPWSCRWGAGSQLRTVSPSGFVWQCLEVLLVFSSGGKWVLASGIQWEETSDTAKSPTRHSTAPQQGVIWPHMSAMLRSRALNESSILLFPGVMGLFLFIIAHFEWPWILLSSWSLK